nr:hypothetical protein [Clostridia bacterium]
MRENIGYNTSGLYDHGEDLRVFIISVIQIVQDAMTDLFEKYKTMMQSLAYSILKDHQLSEDAVQEALIRLSQNKEKIGNINSRETKSYIYTVTKNEALRLAEKEINKNKNKNLFLSFYLL